MTYTACMRSAVMLVCRDTTTRGMNKAEQQCKDAGVQLVRGTAPLQPLSLHNPSGRVHVTDAHFLADEAQTRDVSWPGFPEWCLQDTPVTLGPMIFGLRRPGMEQWMRWPLFAST